MYAAQPYSQPMMPQTYVHSTPPPPPPAAPRGFFAGLFDLSFSSFVTTKIIKALYVFWMAVTGVAFVIGIVGGIFRIGDDPAVGILMVLATPLAALLYIVLGRIYLELLIVLFRIAENIGEINQKTRG
jgi:hypothetical protein